LTGKKELLKRIFNEQLMNTGSGLPPFHAWLLLRGLRTLPMRLERVSKTTKEVFEWLKKQPQIQKVIFPFDPDFEQYDLAKKQMKDAFGLLTILPKTKSQNNIEKFTFSLNHFLMAVSWGGHESLILPQAASLSAEQFDPENERHRLIRIYIGLEDADYLINDLEQALAVLNS
jgi:cystathionine beta-lyase/cystathionine gamma-synthase